MGTVRSGSTVVRDTGRWPSASISYSLGGGGEGEQERVELVSWSVALIANSARGLRTEMENLTEKKWEGKSGQGVQM